jgi:hypothetical protein
LNIFRGEGVYGEGACGEKGFEGSYIDGAERSNDFIQGVIH